MGQPNLDRHIKAALEHHVTPIDTDVIWAGIQQKKSYSIYKKIGLGIVGLGLIALGSFFFINSIPLKNNVQGQSELSISSEVNSNQYTNSKINQVRNSSISEKSIEEGDATNETKNITEIKSNQKELELELTSTINKQDVNKIQRESNALSTNTFESKNKKESISLDYTRSNLNSEVSANYNKLIHRNNQDLAVNKIKKENKGEGKNTLNKSINFSENNINSNNSLSVITSFEPENKYLTISLMDKISKFNPINILSNSKKDAEHKNERILPALENCFRYNKKSVECYNHGKKTNPIYLQTYASLDYVFKSRSVAELSESYKALRDTTSFNQISQRAGIQLKYLFSNGLFVKSGLEHAIVRETFKYQEVDISWSIEPNQLIAIDIDENGDTTKTFGNAPVKTEKIVRWKINNSYKSLGIPLILGYQTRVGGISCSLEAGAIYNLSYGFNGWLINAAIEPEEGIDYFKDKTNFALTGGLNLIYKLDERMNSFVSLSFRKDMRDINNPDINFINQKNMHVGLGVGIEWRLTK